MSQSLLSKLDKKTGLRLAALGALLLMGLLLAACTGKQPQISLEKERFDLGDVVNGEIVSQEMLVWNKGEADLIVEAVTTSCGCTKATLEPMTIPPGGSGVLRLEFDSGAHGPELTGEFTRQIFIASNDPEQLEALVELKANILPGPPP